MEGLTCYNKYYLIELAKLASKETLVLVREKQRQWHDQTCLQVNDFRGSRLKKQSAMQTLEQRVSMC